MTEIKQKHSDKKILASDSSREKNKKFLHAVSGDYDLDLVYKEETNHIEKNKVIVNPVNEVFEGSDLVEKMIGIRGTIAQQAFHKKYTDYSVVEELENKHGVYSKKYEISKDYL